VQEKSSPMLEKATTMKGKLYFQKPNNIRWEYLGEKASAMVFTADKVVLESKGKKRIYDIAKNPMLAKLNALISGSINGNFLSQKEFDITVGQVKEHFEVVLKPKVNATRLFLKQITLMVLASGDVNSIVMTGKNNDITRIDFSNHQKNVSIDAGIFQP
jgi:outer membrane lipoprotein carrier protein